MPRATWEALRSHIITERRRKQEEEEKTEEYERLKKEREHRKKQEATSLEETKEQISELERKLTNLKDEKHQLFLTLKKVLNEDETRRRKESDEMNILYGVSSNSPVLPLTGHTPHPQHIYMNPRQPSHYMKPHIPGVPAAAAQIKRQRSPSPPRAQLPNVNSAYYRAAPMLGRIPVSSVYGHPSASSTGAPTYAMSTSSAAYPFAAVTQASREEERKQVYLSQPSRYIQQLDPAGQKQPSFPSDRARIGINPVSHSQAVALSASRPPAGSISSGFPMRSSSASLASVANSLISTTPGARLAYTQAAALAASQQQQASSRYYAGIREN
jgi:hypothetical protein